MFGGVGFGQAPFGGTSSQAAVVVDARVATDSASATDTVSGGGVGGDRTVTSGDNAWVSDWDIATAGLGQNEAPTASDVGVAEGLGFSPNRDATDEGFATDTGVAVGLDPITPPPPPPPPPPVLPLRESFIKFVDGISSAAATRLDLSTYPWRCLFEGTETPTPEVGVQRVSSNLVDGERIVSQVYRNRRVRLHIKLEKVTPAVAHQQIQLLNRELARERNVLWWQPDDSMPPVFFRTFRSTEYQTEIDYGLVNHGFTLDLEADPGMYGPPETMTVNFGADPAGSLKPWVDLPPIKGDIPSPLYITTSSTSVSLRGVVLSVRRRGTPSVVSPFRQAESLTLGPDATTAAGGTANLATSGNQQVHINFESQTGMVQRLSGTFPDTGHSTVDALGTYRVIARMRQGLAGTVRVRLATGVDQFVDRPVVLHSGAFPPDYSLYDLGRVRFPSGNPGVAAGFGAPHTVAPNTLRIYAERTAGAATLQVDEVITVPADQDYALVQCPTISGGTEMVFDGPNQQVYVRDSSGRLAAPSGPALRLDGRLPSVDPATPNRLFCLWGVGTALSSNITNTATLTLTYWPQYLLARSEIL